MIKTNKTKIENPVCKRCGDCCKSKTLLKHCTDEEKEAFKIFYIMMGEDINNKKCAFLDFKIGLAICKIYQERPQFCQDFYCEKCY